MKNRKTTVLNSPIELALRILLIIEQHENFSLSKERLVIYDYFILNSGDFPDAPKSLHPAIPNRSVQLYVKRGLIDKALNILLSKELIALKMSSSGLLYTKTQITSAVTNMLTTSYSDEIKRRVAWVVDTFTQLSEKELEDFILKNGYKWESEFGTLTTIDE